MEQVNEIISVLTTEEQQLLKDTIIYGAWGDSETNFLDENNNIVEDSMFAYCTNDAKNAGNFSGRKISTMFRSIYKKLCPTTVGRYVSHCSDWWGDGNGDMLFIRYDYVDAFEKWARK